MAAEEPFLGEALEDDQKTDDHEILSLCDLQLHSDQSAEYWEQTQSHTLSSDYFEFFGQDSSPPSSPTMPGVDIIFCGKLIPTNTSKRQSVHSKFTQNKESLQCSSPSKLYSDDKPRKGQRGNFEVHRMSTMLSSSSTTRKAKWYLFLFGINSRFSTELELKSFKRRLSYQHHHPLPSPTPPRTYWLHNCDYEDDDEAIGGRTRRWGLWGLIMTALSCGGNNRPTTTMTMTSLGCSK